MVKYRRLTQEELNELEKDYVKFLAAQSITADDWIGIKKKDLERMNELIDQFSDIVMEKVLSTISYLEMLSEKEVKIFKTDENNARLVGLRILEGNLDLRNEKDFSLVFSKMEELKSQKIELFELEKRYTKSKAEEVFFLIKNGALICDNKLFDLIDSLLKANH